MKKANSSMSKDLAGRLLVDAAIVKTQRWAKKEFNKLRNSDRIICANFSDTLWTVGRFQLEQLGQHAWKLTDNIGKSEIFYCKQSAVFYAIYTQIKMFNRASTILEQDTAVALYKAKLDFYSQKLLSRDSKGFNRDLQASRYSDYRAKYAHAKQELEKTLIRAKYSKVWDSLL